MIIELRWLCRFSLGCWEWIDFTLDTLPLVSSYPVDMSLVSTWAALPLVRLLHPCMCIQVC